MAENLVYIINYFIFALQKKTPTLSVHHNTESEGTTKQTTKNNKIMQNNNFSEAQSIELITSMIQDSRARLARNSGTPFLIWGYTTVAISILNYVLSQYDIQYWWLWWLIPIIGWVGMMIWGKHDNGAKNYIDRVISIIWCVIGISFLWIMLAFVYYHAPILFLVILMTWNGNNNDRIYHSRQSHTNRWNSSYGIVDTLSLKTMVDDSICRSERYCTTHRMATH